MDKEKFINPAFFVPLLSLEEVTLEGVGDQHASSDMVRLLYQSARLVRLTVRFAVCSPSGLEAFGEALSSAKHLRSLTIQVLQSAPPPKSPAIGFCLLQVAEALAKGLNLTSVHISDGIYDELAVDTLSLALARHSHMRSLTLSGALSETAAESMCLSKLIDALRANSSLVELSLQGLHTTKSFFESLASALPRNRSLSALAISIDHALSAAEQTHLVTAIEANLSVVRFETRLNAAHRESYLKDVEKRVFAARIRNIAHRREQVSEFIRNVLSLASGKSAAAKTTGQLGLFTIQSDVRNYIFQTLCSQYEISGTTPAQRYALLSFMMENFNSIREEIRKCSNGIVVSQKDNVFRIVPQPLLKQCALPDSPVQTVPNTLATVCCSEALSHDHGIALDGPAQEREKSVQLASTSECCSAMSFSTYPSNPGAYDLNCDRYSVVEYRNWIIAALSDGCNLGLRPFSAACQASRAFSVFVSTLLRNHSLPTVAQLANIVQDALVSAHERIMDAYLDWELGSTTLTGGVLVPVCSSTEEKFAFVCCRLGDVRAFVWRPSTQSLVVLHEELRDPRNPGGRLGLHSISARPDMKNLKVSVHLCCEGDVIFLLSDGIWDNLDPSTLEKAPADCGLAQYANWKQVPDDAKLQAIRKYEIALLKEILVACENRLDAMLQSIHTRIRHIVKKQDHSTAVAIRVTKDRTPAQK